MADEIGWQEDDAADEAWRASSQWLAEENAKKRKLREQAAANAKPPKARDSAPPNQLPKQ
jgi:hypothetical protein